MKVYGDPGSTCTMKVLITLAEKEHPAEFIHVSVPKGEHKGADHLARQPFGVVPVLDDDGFVLYESRAIVRYLDQKLPKPALTPTNIQDRARMDQWMSIEQSYFSGTAMKAIVPLLLQKFVGIAPDMTAVEQAKAAMAKPLDVLEQHLATHDYLAGKQFSLADIVWAPYLHYLAFLGMGKLLTDRRAAASWWERVSSRPALRKGLGG